MSCDVQFGHFITALTQDSTVINALGAKNSAEAKQRLERYFNMMSARPFTTSDKVGKTRCKAKCEALFGMLEQNGFMRPVHGKDKQGNIVVGAPGKLPRSMQRTAAYAAVYDVIGCAKNRQPMPDSARELFDQMNKRGQKREASSLSTDKSGYYRCESCGRFASNNPDKPHICPITASASDLKRHLKRRFGVPDSAYSTSALDQLFEEAKISRNHTVAMRHGMTGEEVRVDLDAVPLMMRTGYAPKCWRGMALKNVVLKDNTVVTVTDAQGCTECKAGIDGYFNTAQAYGVRIHKGAKIVGAYNENIPRHNVSNTGAVQVTPTGKEGLYDHGRFVGHEYRKKNPRYGKKVDINGYDYTYGTSLYRKTDYSSARREGAFPEPPKGLNVGTGDLLDAAALLSKGNIVENDEGVIQIYNEDFSQLLSVYDPKTNTAGDTDGSSGASSAQFAAVIAHRAMHPTTAYDALLSKDVHEMIANNGSPMAVADGAYISLIDHGLRANTSDTMNFGASVGAVKCPKCGQWAGDAHVCPTKGDSIAEEEPASDAKAKSLEGLREEYKQVSSQINKLRNEAKEAREAGDAERERELLGRAAMAANRRDEIVTRGKALAAEAEKPDAPRVIKQPAQKPNTSVEVTVEAVEDEPAVTVSAVDQVIDVVNSMALRQQGQSYDELSDAQRAFILEQMSRYIPKGRPVAQVVEEPVPAQVTVDNMDVNLGGVNVTADMDLDSVGKTIADAMKGQQQNVQVDTSGLAEAFAAMAAGQKPEPSSVNVVLDAEGLAEALAKNNNSKELKDLLKQQKELIESLKNASSGGSNNDETEYLRRKVDELQGSLADAINRPPVVVESTSGAARVSTEEDEKVGRPEAKPKTKKCCNGSVVPYDQPCPPPDLKGTKRPEGLETTAQEHIFDVCFDEPPDLDFQNVPDHIRGRVDSEFVQRNVPDVNPYYFINDNTEKIMRSVSAMLQLSQRLPPERRKKEMWSRCFGLYGPSSTGKNEMIRQIAASLKTKDANGDVVQGFAVYEQTLASRQLPKLQREVGEVVIENGETKVRLGPLGLAAVQGGYVIAVNEIVRNPEDLDILQSIIEDGVISMSSPEGGLVSVPIHPSTVFAFTWNPGYDDNPDRPGRATLSRMTTFRMEDPTVEEKTKRTRAFMSRVNGDSVSDMPDEIGEQNKRIRGENFKIPDSISPSEESLERHILFSEAVVNMARGTGGAGKLGEASITTTEPVQREIDHYVALAEMVGVEHAMEVYKIACDQDESLESQWGSVMEVARQIYPEMADVGGVEL